MTKAENVSLLQEVRDLRRRGQADEGERILLAAANEGDIEAMVELAHWFLDAEKKTASDEWIRIAETSVQPSDEAGHLALNSAYTLGLGDGDRASQDRRAQLHLEQVAAMGNLAAMERLALGCLQGAIGFEKSKEKFEYWVNRAMSAGSLSAVVMFVQYLHEQGHEVPPHLIAELEGVRHESSEVDRLIRAIHRHRRRG